MVDSWLFAFLDNRSSFSYVELDKLLIGDDDVDVAAVVEEDRVVVVRKFVLLQVASIGIL